MGLYGCVPDGLVPVLVISQKREIKNIFLNVDSIQSIMEPEDDDPRLSGTGHKVVTIHLTEGNTCYLAVGTLTDWIQAHDHGAARDKFLAKHALPQDVVEERAKRWEEEKAKLAKAKSNMANSLGELFREGGMEAVFEAIGGKKIGDTGLIEIRGANNNDDDEEQEQVEVELTANDRVSKGVAEAAAQS